MDTFLPLPAAVILFAVSFVLSCNKKLASGGIVFASFSLALAIVIVANFSILSLESALSLVAGSIVGFIVGKRIFPESGINPADSDRWG